MLNFQEQKELFALLGKTLKKRVEAYVIGGSAMLFYNLSKTATKDVDVVAFSESDRKTLRQALERIGFKVFAEPDRKGHPMRLSLGERIVDIFSGSVMHIKLSESMLARVREKAEFGNFTALVASPEDMIFTKCMTDREGDRKDAADIVTRANIDWNAVIAEAEWQAKHNPDKIFGVYLFDFLDDLYHNFGAEIPRDVVKRLIKMYKEGMEEAQRRLASDKPDTAPVPKAEPVDPEAPKKRCRPRKEYGF